MNKYAIIENGVVTNICLWDGITEWLPPENSSVVQLVDTSVCIGFLYSDGQFTPPPSDSPVGDSFRDLSLNRERF